PFRTSRRSLAFGPEERWPGKPRDGGLAGALKTRGRTARAPTHTPDIQMKTELVDVNETRRNLVVEIPTAEVESAIDRVTREYTRSARLPGFRPGKVPASVVRQRFRAQILHDVAHDLIPKSIDSALAAKGVEP